MADKVKIVVLAGGKGTRFTPITSSLPKEMFPLVDKPVIQYVLEECLVEGVEEAVLIVSNEKKVLLDYLEESGDDEFKTLLNSVKLTILYRKEDSPLGNGASIVDYKEHFQDGPFLVLWGDSFALRKHGRVEALLKIYGEVERPIVNLLPIFDRARYIYAIPEVERDNDGRLIVKRIHEKPGLKKIDSDYTFANGYLLEPDIFPYLKKVRPSKKGEIVLEKAIDQYCQENLVYGKVFEGPFFDAGNKQDFVRSSLELLWHRVELRDIYDEIVEEIKRGGTFAR